MCLQCAQVERGSDQVNQVWYGVTMATVGNDHTVTVTEAKTQLSSLIERVTDGEEIVIRRGQRPVAKIVAYTTEPKSRKPGGLEGQIWMSDDFDKPDEEIERLFGTRD
jgi:prevent-host-death family protein